MTIKLKKQFSDFHGKIKKDKETSTLIEKRDKLKSDIEKYLPDELNEYGISVNKSDLRFINQGSYKIGTTIQSNDGQSVDLDYAVIIPIDKEEHDDPRQVKKAVKESLIINNIRIPKIKEPCVTIAYHANGEEFMHIDFPIYAEYDGKLYLARGKETSENYDWEIADPEGLSAYFLDKFSDNEQLKRIVRYIKKWKQEKYNGSTNSNEVPPSVGLTILACENFIKYSSDDGDDDLSALYYTVNNIKNKFSVTRDENSEIIEANISCGLPVEPYSDVFYKLKKSSAHMITFYKRLSKACENLNEAMNIDDEHEAAKKVVKVLGEEFDIPEKEVVDAKTSNKGEYSFGLQM